MPLRDHFRPPVCNQASWERFHGAWPMMRRLRRPAATPQIERSSVDTHGRAAESGPDAIGSWLACAQADCAENRPRRTCGSAWTIRRPWPARRGSFAESLPESGCLQIPSLDSQRALLGLGQEAGEPVDGIRSARDRYTPSFSGDRRRELGDLLRRWAGKSAYNVDSTISRSVSTAEAPRNRKHVKQSVQGLVRRDRHAMVLELHYVG
jgi:hypothetical protein